MNEVLENRHVALVYKREYNRSIDSLTLYRIKTDQMLTDSARRDSLTHIIREMDFRIANYRAETVADNVKNDYSDKTVDKLVAWGYVGLGLWFIGIIGWLKYVQVFQDFLLEKEAIDKGLDKKLRAKYAWRYSYLMLIFSLAMFLMYLAEKLL